MISILTHVKMVELGELSAHIYQLQDPFSPRILFNFATLALFPDGEVLGDPPDRRLDGSTTQEAFDAWLDDYRNRGKVVKSGPVFRIGSNPTQLSLMYVPNCERVGSFYVTKDTLTCVKGWKQITNKRLDWLAKQVKRELREYNCYLARQVYGFTGLDSHGDWVAGGTPYYGLPEATRAAEATLNRVRAERNS